MDAEIRAELARFRAEMESLIAARTRNIPVLFPTFTQSYDIITVGGGNSISPAGFIGIKKVLSTLSSVPNYDPTTLPATIDGIGYGWHYRLNTWVLLANDQLSGVGHDVPADAPCFCPSSPRTITGVTVWTIALV